MILITLSGLWGPGAVANELDEVIQQFERDIELRRKKEAEEREREKNRNAMERALHSTHTDLSDSIFAVSDSIDEFFSRERTELERTGSRIRLSYETLFVEFKDPLHNINLNTKLVLPRTQEKLNFLLQSLEDDLRAEEAGAPAEEKFQSLDEERKQSFFAGLRFKGVQTKEWSLNTDAGVKLVWPPDPFARLRVRKSFFLSKWELRLTENVYWFESEGWWQVAAIELERPFPPKNLLRFGNNGLRRDEKGFWEFNHYIGWYHQSSRTDGLGYSAGITSVEEPAYSLQSYYVSVSYRRNVFEEWIFLDIVPTGAWPRDENFSFVPSLRIKLEAVFGDI